MLFNVLKWFASFIWTVDPNPDVLPPGPLPNPTPTPVDPDPVVGFDLLAMIKKAITLVDDTIEFLEKLVAITPTPTDNAYLDKLKAVVDVLRKALDSPILQQLLQFLTNHPGVLSTRDTARNAAIVSITEQNATAYKPSVEAMGIPWALLIQVLPLVVRFLLSFAGKRQVQFAVA